MRILKYTLSLLVGILCLSGCMQQNGHIGHWFGTWHLTSITIDGAEDPDYLGNIFFQFQTDIVSIRTVSTDVSNDAFACFGRWSEEDSTLTLDFSYNADGATSSFTPPTETHLIYGINILHIDKSGSRSMTWTYQQPETGETITYTLKKQ